MTNNPERCTVGCIRLFGMSLFVVTLGWETPSSPAPFTLALMSLPLIIRTTEEAPQKHRRFFPTRQSGTGSNQVTDHSQGCITDGFSEYHYRINPVYRTYPARRLLSCLPLPLASCPSCREASSTSVWQFALSSVCYFHQRNGHRSLAWNGLRNGSGTDCNRINRKLTGQCAERLFRQKVKMN